jgi:hypothetical protein
MGIIQQTKMMLSCNTGCGEVYWDEWLSDPPDCCDPCDNHGNWTGLGACCLPPFSWCNMFGVRHTGVDSASCSSCSSCDDKAHSFSLHGHKGAQAPLPVEGQTVLVDEYWEDGKGIDDSVTVVEGPTVVDHDPAPAPSHAKRTYRTRRR